jgi:hypothetical protein
MRKHRCMTHWTTKSPKSPIRRFGSVDARISVSRSRSTFFELPAPRSEASIIRFGMGSVRVDDRSGRRKSRQVFDFPLLQRRVSVPLNPLVPGSSPRGSTISHKLHRLMAGGPRDRNPLVYSIVGALRGKARDGRLGVARQGNT